MGTGYFFCFRVNFSGKLHFLFLLQAIENFSPFLQKKQPVPFLSFLRTVLSTNNIKEKLLQIRKKISIISFTGLDYSPLPRKIPLIRESEWLEKMVSREKKGLCFLFIFTERRTKFLFCNLNRTVCCPERDLRSSLTNLTFKTAP